MWMSFLGQTMKDNCLMPIFCLNLSKQWIIWNYWSFNYWWSTNSEVVIIYYVDLYIQLDERAEELEWQISSDTLSI